MHHLVPLDTFFGHDLHRLYQGHRIEGSHRACPCPCNVRCLFHFSAEKLQRSLVLGCKLYDPSSCEMGSVLLGLLQASPAAVREVYGTQHFGEPFCGMEWQDARQDVVGTSEPRFFGPDQVFHDFVGGRPRVVRCEQSEEFCDVLLEQFLVVFHGMTEENFLPSGESFVRRLQFFAGFQGHFPHAFGIHVVRLVPFEQHGPPGFGCQVRRHRSMRDASQLRLQLAAHGSPTDDLVLRVLCSSRALVRPRNPSEVPGFFPPGNSQTVRRNP
mmetsp:Transcript_5508/g.34047  ORF Transcript_5508/g.34047 Transcript_5508/m.34047 type:complete len:270 (+) Transcript_5508:6790-7599(+)